MFLVANGAGGEDDGKERPFVCAPRYKGCFTSRKRQSVFESLAKANAAKSKQPSEKENETKEEYMEPARKRATRSQEVSFYSMNFIQLTQNCNMFCTNEHLV